MGKGTVYSEHIQTWDPWTLDGNPGCTSGLKPCDSRSEARVLTTTPFSNSILLRVCLLVLTCTAKPKKPTKEERIAEKKAKRRAEEKSQPGLELKSEAPETAEEALEEKLKQQRLQEESDLALAMETFGVKHKLIDAMEPKSEEEFTEFQEALTAKITKFEVTDLHSLLVVVIITSVKLQTNVHVDPNSSFHGAPFH